MPNRNLYLYEVVDVIGQGQYDYMEHLWQDPVLRMPEMFGLQGSFYVCAAGGGRWPQVINIWDVGSEGWTAWAKNVDRMNLKRRKAFYGDWWDESAKWRSGGFDRLCAADASRFAEPLSRRPPTTIGKNSKSGWPSWLVASL